MNTPELTLRRGALDFEEAALVKQCTATKEASETWSHLKMVTQRTFHSQRPLASLRHWSEPTGQHPDEWQEQKLFSSFRQKSGIVLLRLMVTMWNPKQSTKPNIWRLGPVAPSNEGRDHGTPRQRDLEPSQITRRQGRHSGQMALQRQN